MMGHKGIKTDKSPFLNHHVQIPTHSTGFMCGPPLVLLPHVVHSLQHPHCHVLQIADDFFHGTALVCPCSTAPRIASVVEPLIDVDDADQDVHAQFGAVALLWWAELTAGMWGSHFFYCVIESCIVTEKNSIK